MKSVALAAHPRAVARRAGVKRLRSQGRVPAIIYGRQTQAQNLEIDRKEIEDLIRKALQFLSVEQVWVNPDCGLKTRKWEEVQHSQRWSTPHELCELPEQNSRGARRSIRRSAITAAPIRSWVVFREFSVNDVWKCPIIILLLYLASWRMMPSVWRCPQRRRLTPCRRLTRWTPRFPCTGR